MSEHTPGPWIVFYSDDEFEVLPAGRSGGVAVVSSIHDRDANARLIAAAPELLEELKDMTNRVETAARLHGNDDDVIATVTEKARAAIAKAEGRS